MQYTVTLSGPRSVTADSDLYLTCTSVSEGLEVDTPEDQRHLIFLYMPPELHLISGYNEKPEDERADSARTAVDQPYIWYGADSSSTLRIRSAMKPGWHECKFSVSAMGQVKELGWRYQILPRETVITLYKRQPQSIVKWEKTALTLGGKWADWVNATKLSFGCETEVWYYDGGRVYLAMAEYFQDPAWLKPAETILSQYADYIIAAKGEIPGWRKFPFGLLKNYRRTGDGTSLAAVTALYQSVATPYLNGAAPCRGQLVEPPMIRELAYAIDCLVTGLAVDLPAMPYLRIAVDGALGLIDRLFVSEPMLHVNQPFFGGLLAEALIEYCEVTGDPRIPPALKTMLDWYWAHCVDQQTGAMLYSTQASPPVYATDLNNLIAPAYRWYAEFTRDQVARVRWEFLFSHSLDSDIGYSGKIFSQNFKWTFPRGETRRS